jgi:hypothetical protein
MLRELKRKIAYGSIILGIRLTYVIGNFSSTHEFDVNSLSSTIKKNKKIDDKTFSTFFLKHGLVVR